MFRIIVLLASLAVCHNHAVLPLVAPAHHGPLVAPVPLHGHAGHGYGGYALGYGYGGFGGQGYGAGLVGGQGFGGLGGQGFGGLGGQGFGGLGGQGFGGLGGHGLAHGALGGLGGHGLAHTGHHLLKRSPHVVAPLAHVGHLEHVAPIAHVVPAAVSHHSRLDVHHSPAVLATSVVHPVVPLVHKAVVAPLHFGAGLYGAGHFGGQHYGAGHF